MSELDAIRDKIDGIDDKILELLDQRMMYVKSIAKIKQNSQSPIYQPKRERTIINRLKKTKLEFLDPNAIESIYQEIFTISKKLESL